MANSYETPAEDAADTMPESPAEDQGEGGKISQQQANYRESDRTRCCGLCQYFTGSAGADPNQCTKVDGNISAYGFSDLYQAQENPFRAAAMPQVVGQQPTTPGEMAVAQATAAGPPATMIGGKMYQ